mgnify:CR=1 FL=1
MRIIAIALLFASTTPAMCRPMLEERASFHHNGRLAERRHFFDGKEEGLQQAWTEDGQLYINYEMRNGRRYGVLNARPCNPVGEGASTQRAKEGQ